MPLAKSNLKTKDLMALFLSLALIALTPRSARAVESAALDYLKSKFTLSYHGEYYFTRPNAESENSEDHKISNIKIMHNPTIKYKPTQNVSLLLTSEFKYTDDPTKPNGFINRHFRSLAIATLENVLTEKTDGLKLDLGVARRIMDRNHGAAFSYGTSRVRANLAKKFGNVSTSMLMQYMNNDPVHAKITSNTWRQGLNLLPSVSFDITDNLNYLWNDDFFISTPWISNDNRNIDISHEMNLGFLTYKINDKNSTYFQLKYLHSSSNAFELSRNAQDEYEYYFGYTWNATDKLSMTPEFGGQFARSKDQRDFFSKKAKYPEFAFYLDYTL